MKVSESATALLQRKADEFHLTEVDRAAFLALAKIIAARRGDTAVLMRHVAQAAWTWQEQQARKQEQP